MEEVSLKELYYILRKWAWLIIVLPIVAIIVSWGVSQYIIEPEYETFTTMMVGKPEEHLNESKLEYNELILNQKLVSTYGEIVKSRRVTDKVIENLDLTVSYENFRNKVSVNLINDTEIIKLQVTDTDPVLAAEIANETAQVFMGEVQSIMNIENVQIIDPAQVAENPFKPRTLMNMAIAGVLGLMIAVFIAFLIEFMDNSIKTPEDVENHLGLAVLGTIPKIEEEKN